MSNLEKNVDRQNSESPDKIGIPSNLKSQVRRLGWTTAKPNNIPCTVGGASYPPHNQQDDIYVKNNSLVGNNDRCSVCSKAPG